ncbi:hypothetical protein [Pseudomonas coronafaciens]|uniref:hypothetical protein n=1 Tax=Pseudomonas coronafaciens TaxID=53409 RepID=UPI003787487C
MKIWACARGANGFINREDGRYKLFFIWQVLKMRRLNPSEFSALTFFSTHSRIEKRREMVAVKNGYFRYKSAEAGHSRSGDSDGESLPHAYLIAILSQLPTINFKIGDEVVPFTLTRLVAEEIRLKFGNGNGYIPDLYGEFTSDNPFYKKWGGKVAIEVCYSNPCSMQKVVDLRDHGIPIIEVKIARSINIETYIDKNDIEGSIERGYQKITDIASNQLFCKVLSDPVSVQFHEEYVRQADKEKEGLVEKNKRETKFLFNKLQEAESLAANLGKERDVFAEAKSLVEKDKAGLEVATTELTQVVADLQVELGTCKKAYTNKVHEVDSLKAKLEITKSGWWAKLKESFNVKKTQKKP